MARYDEIADTVESRFSEASAFKDEAWGLVKRYIEDIANARPPAQNFGTDVNLNWYDSDIDIDISTDISAPPRPTPSLEIPSMPAPTPSIPDVDVDPAEIPRLDVPLPIYDYGITKPDAEFPDDFTEDPPDEDPITFPSPPEYTLPSAPEFDDDISVEGPPDVTLPDFNIEAPIFEIEAPGNTFAYSETPYSSTLLDAAKEYLLYQIENGGTGLDADVEQALIDRAQARKELERQSKYNEAEQYFSGRGHTLPPGALSARILNIQEQIGKETQQQDDDILIEQARLAQTNTHFVVEQALVAENLTLDHFNKTAQRTFEVARVGAQFDIDICNILIAHYNAQLDGWKTKAQVYEIRIKAASLILEQYKLTLEGKELQGKLREIVLNQYNLQIQGIQMLVNLYQTEAQVAKIKSDVNLNRIQGYQARIEAYTARIGAVTAQYNAYMAELTGEKTKAEVYMTQVQAYSEEVKAIGVGKGIEIENARLQLQEGQMDIELYKSKLEAFKAELQGNVSEIEAESTVYKAAVSGYEAEIKALVTEAETEVEAYKQKYIHERNLIDQRIQKSRMQVEYDKNVFAMELDKWRAIADINAQVVASALSGVTAGASYGYDEGVKTNYSYDQTKAVPETSYVYQGQI